MIDNEGIPDGCAPNLTKLRRTMLLNQTIVNGRDALPGVIMTEIIDYNGRCLSLNCEVDKMRRICYIVVLIVGLFSSACESQAVQAALVSCEQDVIDAALAELGSYTPLESTAFITLDSGSLMLGETPYFVRGINYYPARYPWRRFLTETETDSLRTEFTFLRDAGINTLRIFLWQYALFICPDSPGVPHVSHFKRLDSIIQTAAEYDFKLIVTLNDMPDLDHLPLYDNPERIQNQMRFIVERYRDEPAILAWDVRNEGDIDYGTHSQIEGKFTKEHVIGWLEQTSAFVRELDANHLITAGWLYDAEATAPHVDFVSFHHWTSVDELKARVEIIRAATDKPILLQEFGYSTLRAETPTETQAALIGDVFAYTSEAELLGAMLWTAFDFPLNASCYPSPCENQDNAEHHFGIWTSDYGEKPAVAVLRALSEMP